MKKLLKWIAIVAAIFILTAWAVGSYLAVDDLSHCEPTPSAKKGCHEADAVVAVSGGDTKARTAEAIKLFKNGWGEVLIFSGAAADKTGPSNARVMAEQAIVEGVPPTKIIIEETSETTLQNAVQTSSIIKDNNITSVILVTSAYHERRALLEFERRSPSVDLRGHPVAQDKQWGPLWWLTPIGWRLAIPEVVHSLMLSVGGVDRQ